jgi:hypothetical protein
MWCTVLRLSGCPERRPTPYCNKAYALVWNGNTKNRRRDLDRHFYGYDFRWTSRAIQGLRTTAYVKKKVELNEAPPFFLSDQGEPIVDPAAIGVTEDELLGGIRFSDTRRPVEYDRLQAGYKFRWNPFEGSCWLQGWALTGGYEFHQIDRSHVTYVIGDSDFPARGPLEDRLAAGWPVPHPRSRAAGRGPHRHK